MFFFLEGVEVEVEKRDGLRKAVVGVEERKNSSSFFALFLSLFSFLRPPRPRGRRDAECQSERRGQRAENRLKKKKEETKKPIVVVALDRNFNLRGKNSPAA